MALLSASDRITDEFTAAVCERLASDKHVRRTLPGGGRLHIDRRLPFLCAYREPGPVITGHTPRLVVSEAAYLVAPGTRELHESLRRLVGGIADVMVDAFGAFLLIELWADDSAPGPPREATKATRRNPTFRILTHALPEDDPTVQQLARSLAEIPLRPPPLDVEVETTDVVGPPEMPPLLAPPHAGAAGRYSLGLAVQPVYRQAKTRATYPAVFRTLRHGLSQALKQTAFHFAVTHSTHEPKHYHALGRRIAVRAARQVDEELTAIARSFDFLLQVTPVNVARARAAFESNGTEREPSFDYRPLAVDTDTLKRRLFNLPIERLEDPTLAHLLGDARDALDRTLTMLADRNTPRFLYGSLAAYGPVEPALHRLALDLLAALPAEGPGSDAGSRVGAEEFARLAEREIGWYRDRHPEVAATVEVRDDVSGLLVSRGDLLVGSRLGIPASRADAMLQHEVGTHIVTYYNGLAQPLGLLATGLAGYEELQEGLAVLAEHLSGALYAPRLRTLAGRVLAVRHVVDGASFVDSFRELTGRHGFTRDETFLMCMRAHRSGGLTKDAIYLRGLVQLLAYLREDGDLDPLFIGKVALSHAPVIQELRWREYLRPPPLQPRYFETAAARDRLARIRRGVSVLDLVNELPQ